MPDLVAYAIPRFRKSAQRFGSVALCVRRVPAKSGFVSCLGIGPARAEAPVHSRLLTARDPHTGWVPRSCPDTKQSWNLSISQPVSSCADTNQRIYAGCLILNCQPLLFFGRIFLTAGETDAAGEIGAVAMDRIHRQFTSTSQRRIGGHRNL